MNDEPLIHACVNPTEQEVIDVIRCIPGWCLFKVEIITGFVLRHYKGRCNPSVIKQIVEDFTKGRVV